MHARRREEQRARRTEPVAELAIWADGPDLMIAVSAERAARICNDPLGPNSDEDLYSSPADWRRVEGVLELHGEALHVDDWIGLYGEGWLVVDGELAPRWP